MLSDSVIEFLLSRRISVMCTRGADNQPAIHECFISDVTGDQVVGLVPEHLAGHLERNVADNGHASILMSRQPGDHRSVQLKGRVTAIEPAQPRPDLFQPLSQYTIWIYRHIMDEARARAQVALLERNRVFHVRFAVAEVYDQTPGPGAGRRIAGGNP